MTHRDIYIKFMIGYDKANVTSSYPSLTEYEVATFLDKAYLALIAQKVTGNNSRHIGFEQDLKLTEDLGPLVKTKRILGGNTSHQELPYVTNAISCEKPDDWLYYVSGELKRDGKTWDMQLIDHNIASKFYTTPYNIPWIKRPVCYEEGDRIYTLYDSILQSGGQPTLALTYIRKPNRFLISDGSSEGSGMQVPTITSANGYYSGSQIVMHIGDSFTLEYDGVTYPNVSVASSNYSVITCPVLSGGKYKRTVTNEYGEEVEEWYIEPDIVTVTAQSVGTSVLTITDRQEFPGWSYTLYIQVIPDDEEEVWTASISPDDDVVYNLSSKYYANIYSSYGRRPSYTWSLKPGDEQYVELITSGGNWCQLRVKDTVPEEGLYVYLYATADIKTIDDQDISVSKPIFVRYIAPQEPEEERWSIWWDDIPDELNENTNWVEGRVSITSTLGNFHSVGIEYLENASDYISVEKTPITDTHFASYDKVVFTAKPAAGDGKIVRIHFYDPYDPTNQNLLFTAEIFVVYQQDGGEVFDNAPDPWVFGSILYDSPYTKTFQPWLFEATVSNVIANHRFIACFHDANVVPNNNSRPDAGWDDETVTVTAPTARTLTYNGTLQPLVNAGTTSSGTMQYKVGSGAWSTLIPTRKDFGDYSVYYKVVDDDNNVVSQSSSPIQVRINRKTIGLTWGTTTFTYDGNSHVPTATATGIESGDSVSVTVLGSAVSAGTHTATATSLSGIGSSNYALSNNNTTQFTIDSSQFNNVTRLEFPSKNDPQVYEYIAPDSRNIITREIVAGLSEVVHVINGELIAGSLLGWHEESDIKIVCVFHPGDSQFTAYAEQVDTITHVQVKGVCANDYSFMIEYTIYPDVQSLNAIRVYGENTYRTRNWNTEDEILIVNGEISGTPTVSDPYTLQIVSYSNISVRVKGTDVGTATVTIPVTGGTTLTVTYKIIPYVINSNVKMLVGETKYVQYYGGDDQPTGFNIAPNDLGVVTPSCVGNGISLHGDRDGFAIVEVVGTRGDIVTIKCSVAAQAVVDPVTSSSDRRTLHYLESEILEFTGKTITVASSTNAEILDWDFRPSSNQITVIGGHEGNAELYIEFDGGLTIQRIHYTVEPLLLSPAPDISNLNRTIKVGEHDIISVTNGTADRVSASEDKWCTISLVNGTVDVYATKVGNYTLYVTTSSGSVKQVHYTVEESELPAYVDGSITRTIYLDTSDEEVIILNDYIDSANDNPDGIVSSNENVLTIEREPSNTCSKFGVKPKSAGSAYVTIRPHRGGTLTVNYTVLTPPVRPDFEYTGGKVVLDNGGNKVYLYSENSIRDGLVYGAIEDYNGFRHLTVGESETATVINGSVTYGLHSNNKDNARYCTITASGNYGTITATYADITRTVYAQCQTYEDWNGNHMYNKMGAIIYKIEPYVPLFYGFENRPPILSTTQKIGFGTIVSDGVWDDYIVVNIGKQRGMIGDGENNQLWNIEYPLIAMDGSDVKAVVVQREPNGPFKYLCMNISGGYTTMMTENSIVSKAIADDARRILCRYGLPMSTSSSSSAQRLMWHDRPGYLGTVTHINPSPQNTGSVGTGTVSPNLSWRLKINPNKPQTIYRAIWKTGDTTWKPDTDFMYVENQHELPLTYEIAEGGDKVIKVTPDGVITIAGPGSTYIKAKYVGNGMYMDQTIELKIEVTAV